MTQEELDALMNGDVQESCDDIADEPVTDTKEEDVETPSGYNEDTAYQWPLPATEENKMVHQLDDVTKESEEKATEIFDIIEEISNELMDTEETMNSVIETLNSNIELFETLTLKFPDVEAFQTQLELNKVALEDINGAVEKVQNSGDSVMKTMDIMQYQDIHRQKIERVINVMRSLSHYMNTLFASKVDDSTRVSTPTHIAGDSTEDLASTDDIEALLAQFGQ